MLLRAVVIGGIRMNKIVRPEGIQSANPKKRARRRPGIFLLEPRVMYDGAAAASAGHHGDHHADHHHTNADGSPGGPFAPPVGTPPAAGMTRAEGASPNSGHAYGSQG